MSRSAAEIKAELDEKTLRSFELDEQITLLRNVQATLNASRKELEREFQTQNALEEQAALNSTG